MEPTKRKMTQVWVSIDPGENIGWALWETKRATLHTPLKFRLIEVGVISSREKIWERRLTATHTSLVSALEKAGAGAGQLDGAAIEMPEFWAGSVGGQAAARKGDLIKLSVSVGWLWGIFASYYSLGQAPGWVEFHPVSKWKGQLPKDVVTVRCRRLLEESDNKFDLSRIRTHAWDAVGIGFYAMGLF